VLGDAVIDLRFRVCDVSRAPLVAEVRLTVHGSIQPPATTTLGSTRGGCRAFRLAMNRLHAAFLRLRVRDDAGLWSPSVRRTLR
jgi:hypothetical protein